VYYYTELKRMSQLNDKALTLVVIAGVFGQVPAVMFCVPQMIQPTGIFGFLDSATEAVTLTVLLLLSSYLIVKVLPYMNITSTF